MFLVTVCHWLVINAHDWLVGCSHTTLSLSLDACQCGYGLDVCSAGFMQTRAYIHCYHLLCHPCNIVMIFGPLRQGWLSRVNAMMFHLCANVRTCVRPPSHPHTRVHSPTLYIRTCFTHPPTYIRMHVVNTVVSALMVGDSCCQCQPAPLPLHAPPPPHPGLNHR